jgi:hypothetical protein
MKFGAFKLQNPKKKEQRSTKKKKWNNKLGTQVP